MAPIFAFLVMALVLGLATRKMSGGTRLLLILAVATLVGLLYLT